MAETNPFTKVQSTVPAGLKWSSEAATKAGNKNSYLRVGGEKVTSRFLSGATRSWGSDDPAENRTIFNTTFRITGTPENVAAALRPHNYDESEIRGVLADSITKDNYQTTKKAEYEAELAEHVAAKQNKPQAECYEWDHILWFAEHLKDAKSVSKKAAPKAPDANGNVAPKAKNVGGKSLGARVDALKAGDLLDVSEMTADFKKICARPKPKTNKSNKAYSDPVPFMSNDLSKYKAIIEHHYGPEGLATYATNIEEVRNKLEGIKQPAPSNIPQPAAHPVTRPVVTGPVTATKSTVPQPQKTVTGPVLTSPKRISTLGGSAFPVIPSLK